ncbi:unnamed protein product [Didymodactylos carnosus]|uniref:Lysozyme n=1 Tax=Didymodactylos carnosus TaxID=1234261 RepID=A0A814TT80_9BILA|nr:unnamed protein product [Didymodactylos carnosus]CAF1165959.1 unnamed protein product [Didymodactylos carnosus]CAF3843526.1 unnamed protein product [Didymodactylos carnosus]CAF3929607.1 unnamed protein product [Didymodactylos carnosus]
MKSIMVALVLIACFTVVSCNFISRKCKCTAVSNTVHYPFHDWEQSSCKFCSCSDPAVVNCQAACKRIVQDYAESGCGKVVKGSIVKHKWDAGNCGGGISSEEYTCA